MHDIVIERVDSWDETGHKHYHGYALVNGKQAIAEARISHELLADPDFWPRLQTTPDQFARDVMQEELQKLAEA